MGAKGSGRKSRARGYYHGRWLTPTELCRISGVKLTTMCSRIAKGRVDDELTAPAMDKELQKKAFLEAIEAQNQARKEARTQQKLRDYLEAKERSRRGLKETDFYLPMGFRPGGD